MAHAKPIPPAVGKGLGGRKPGLANAHPTAKQLDGYRRQLHTQAQAGDTLALGLVVLFDHLRQQQQQEAR
nr:hypothetical protein [uncultured Halomonas sp.]